MELLHEQTELWGQSIQSQKLNFHCEFLYANFNSTFSSIILNISLQVLNMLYYMRSLRILIFHSRNVIFVMRIARFWQGIT